MERSELRQDQGNGAIRVRVRSELGCNPSQGTIRVRVYDQSEGIRSELGCDPSQSRIRVSVVRVRSEIRFGQSSTQTTYSHGQSSTQTTHLAAVVPLPLPRSACIPYIVHLHRSVEHQVVNITVHWHWITTKGCDDLDLLRVMVRIRPSTCTSFAIVVYDLGIFISITDFRARCMCDESHHVALTVIRANWIQIKKATDQSQQRIRMSRGNKGPQPQFKIEPNRFNRRNWN